MNGSVKGSLVGCVLVERILSVLKLLDSLVDFLLGSVGVSNYFLSFSNSLVVCVALFLGRILVGWIGSLKLIFALLISITRVYLTMLSDGIIQLILVGREVIKLCACSIEFRLCVVDSLLRGVLVVLYLIGFIKSLVVICLGFFSCLISFSVIRTVGLLEVRIAYVLELVRCLRTSCGSTTFCSLTISINRLLQPVLVGVRTIKLGACLIKVNRSVIDLRLLLFGKVFFLLVFYRVKQGLCSFKCLIIRLFFISRCIVVLRLCWNVFALNGFGLVLLNRCLQITCFMIRLRNKDNVNRLCRIAWIAALLQINMLIVRHCIRLNKQTCLENLALLAGYLYRASLCIPRIRTGV